MSYSLNYYSFELARKEPSKYIESIDIEFRKGNAGEITVFDKNQRPLMSLTPLFIEIIEKNSVAYILRKAAENDEVLALRTLCGPKFEKIPNAERNEALKTCFKIAFEKKNFTFLAAMIRHKFYKSAVADDLIWALPRAATNGDLKMVEIFCRSKLARELEPYHWNKAKKAALIKAAERGHYKVIIELMQSASETISSIDLRDVFEYARENGHPHVEEELKKKFQSIEQRVVFAAVYAQLAIKNFLGWK